MARRCSAELCSWLAAELVGRVCPSSAEALIAGVEVVLSGIPEPRKMTGEDDTSAEIEAGEAAEAIINSEGEILEGLGAELQERWLAARHDLRQSSFFKKVVDVSVAERTEAVGFVGPNEASHAGDDGEEVQQREHEPQHQYQHLQEEEGVEEWEQLATEDLDDSASCGGGCLASSGPAKDSDLQVQLCSQSCRGIASEPDLSPLCGDRHAKQVFSEMLARERDFAHDWAVFYHTYTWPALVYEVQAALATVLFKFGAKCGALPRFLQAPFGDIPDAAALLRAFPSWPDRDRNPAFKRVAICCATSLVSKDPQVTPTKVFRKAYNASVDNLGMLEDLIAKCGPGLSSSEVKSLVRDIVDAGAQHKLPQATGDSCLNGHLLQIFIRRSCVDTLAYASHPLGVPDISRQPLSKTLAAPGPICGQARLVVNPKIFMRANNVRLYASSACKAFHENRPAFQKCLIALLKPILGSSYSRRQAVEGICNGEVPSWWRDPVSCNSKSSACGSAPTEVACEADDDRFLMEAIQLSKDTFIEEAVQRERRHDIAGSSSTYILKVSSKSDTRRLTVRWPVGASSESMFVFICKDIHESFGFVEVGTSKSPLVYLDEDGDECTLVASTVEDFLTLSKGGVLKLRVANCVTVPVVVARGGRPVSEEFSIATPRSLGPSSPKPLDFADVDFASESGDEQSEWAVLGTSGHS